MFKNFTFGFNDFEAAVIKIDEKKMKNGNPYSLVRLSDGETTIDAKMWVGPAELPFSIESVIKGRIEKQDFNGTDSYILHSAEKTSKDFHDYLPHAPIDANKYFEYIMNTCNDIKDNNIKLIVSSLLNDNKDKFIVHPAAKGVHHNYTNGLLYHTGRMLMCAKALTTVYDDIDKDVLYAGTILHDFGKLKEMQMDGSGNVTYTVDGNLFGHALICIEWIDEYARNNNIDLNYNKLVHLKHLIASHHGELEYGAITKPATKEAMLLNQVDLIDSKIWQFENVEETMEKGTMSDRVFGLGANVFNPDRE